jgi:hypothetical protein
MAWNIKTELCLHIQFLQEYYDERAMCILNLALLFMY